MASDLSDARISSPYETVPSHGGHGVVQITKVLEILSAAGIPSCIIGVKALRYHGALGRVADVITSSPFPFSWDIFSPAYS